MKFSITMDSQERVDIFGEDPSREFDMIINGRKFSCEFYECEVNKRGSYWSPESGFEITVTGHGKDKKAQQIAQAKAEVNRTKEAHKEAQRKLSALME